MHNPSMMTFPAPIVHKFVWPQQAPKVDPSRSESGSQLTDFFKISKILCARSQCMTSLTSPGPGIFILTSVNDALTPALKLAPN